MKKLDMTAIRQYGHRMNALATLAIIMFSAYVLLYIAINMYHLEDAGVVTIEPEIVVSGAIIEKFPNKDYPYIVIRSDQGVKSHTVTLDEFYSPATDIGATYTFVDTKQNTTISVWWFIFVPAALVLTGVATSVLILFGIVMTFAIGSIYSFSNIAISWVIGMHLLIGTAYIFKYYNAYRIRRLHHEYDNQVITLFYPIVSAGMTCTDSNALALFKSYKVVYANHRYVLVDKEQATKMKLQGLI